uniref:Uncharacterized protein n=1 Tax=Centroceras clavulatum TaxID=159503 RepID=A0A4D6WQZ1_9FLOR|nr:hypothetical protein [Centroceras clavulatum]
MNINLSKKFHTIFKIKLNPKNKLYQNFDNYIPKEWQSIIINDGSFTQNLNSLFINPTKITMSQKYSIIFPEKLINIRNVWLENDSNNKVTFAKSIWIINKDYCKYNKIFNTIPIGYSLINFEVDIYKNLQEIFCGYCYDLEKRLQSKEIIWGRKYQIFYPNQSSVTIEEYFTPKLVKVFTFI